jgi:phage-related minor tail protein
MKRFFDLYTIIVLTVILLAVIAEILFPPTNWVAIAWMLITAVWVGCARSDQLTAEDWKQLYDTQSKTFNTLRQTWTSTNDELVELRGKYQTAVQDLNNATRKVEELTRALEENKAKKKMVRKKKEEHSEQDITRIKNEMKTAGLVPEKEE